MQAYWITPQTVAGWQRQAALMTQVQGLPAMAAQLLVGAGFDDAARIDQVSLDSVYQQVVAYSETSHGRRCLQRSPVPTRRHVSQWMRQIRLRTHARANSLNRWAA
jgi:hypothetical protein